MSRKLPRCEACGQAFRPDRYNESRRKYCVRPECVRDRKRARQRLWYARKCREEPAFAEAERVRCAVANCRRRERERAVAVSAAPVSGTGLDTAALAEVVIGVVSQLTDSADPAELADSLRQCRIRGRRLAALPGTGPPGG